MCNAIFNISIITMNSKPILATLVSLLVPCTALLSQPAHEADKSMSSSLYSPGEIQWKDGPPTLPRGAKMAVLEGDPTKEGFFVMRLKVPDGYHIPAHTHPNTLTDPGHSHAVSGLWYNASTPGNLAGGGGAGATTITISGNTTGITINNANNTGGGGAHANVQPTMICNFALYAGA